PSREWPVPLPFGWALRVFGSGSTFVAGQRRSEKIPEVTHRWVHGTPGPEEPIHSRYLNTRKCRRQLVFDRPRLFFLARWNRTHGGDPTLSHRHCPEERFMHPVKPIERVVDLTDPNKNIIYNMTVEEARALVAAGDPVRVRTVDGHFA